METSNDTMDVDAMEQTKICRLPTIEERCSRTKGHSSIAPIDIPHPSPGPDNKSTTDENLNAATPRNKPAPSNPSRQRRRWIPLVALSALVVALIAALIAALTIPYIEEHEEIHLHGFGHDEHTSASQDVDDSENDDVVETSEPSKTPTSSPTRRAGGGFGVGSGFDGSYGMVSSPTFISSSIPSLNSTPKQSFKSPTRPPRKNPTNEPTKGPIESPTKEPTSTPTKVPTTPPTKLPTKFPTASPFGHPTAMPSVSPSTHPTYSCESSTEPDDEGLFYWPGAPLIDNFSFMAPQNEEGQRITIYARFYATCKVEHGEIEPKVLSNRLIDIWHPDSDGFYDNQGFNLRGTYVTSDEGEIIIHTILPGRSPRQEDGRRRRMNFKVWRNFSSSAKEFSTGDFVEEFTSQWYFGDVEEEMEWLENRFGGRVIYLNSSNVGFINVYIDVDDEQFVASEARDLFP